MVKNISLKVETVQFKGVVGVCVRRIAFKQQTVLISTSDQYNIDTNTYSDEVQNRRFYFRRVFPKKLNRGVRPSSQNPHPTCDQNVRFFPVPYL